MHRIRFLIIGAGFIVSMVLAGCAGHGSSPAQYRDTVKGTDTSIGPGPQCRACLKDNDCSGGRCVQFPNNYWCEANCTNGGCPKDYTCMPVDDVNGSQVSVCVPDVNPCFQGGGKPPDKGSDAAINQPDNGQGITDTGQVIHDTAVHIDTATPRPEDAGVTDPGKGSDTGSGSPTGKCGNLDLPTTPSCCHSCKASSSRCQANGCYGGWLCNPDTCRCQKPPTTCGSGPGPGPGPGPVSNPGKNLTPQGGKLDTLSFAIVGDTRPPSLDDTSGYPVTIITKIWQDITARNPVPAFTVTTGDYVFADPVLNQASKQLDKYLKAQKVYPNLVFPTLGNHECDGWTSSNCPVNMPLSRNFTAFMEKMLKPLGYTKPYYEIKFSANNGSWTAKFVFIAANSWDDTQAKWLDNVLSQKTTYTFVVRHEPSYSRTAPGVKPSDKIIKNHPMTLLICGHTHTYKYNSYIHTVIVGNGGAPLSGHVNYGYVIARQQADNSIKFTEYDYSTNAAGSSFAVRPDGRPAP